MIRDKEARERTREREREKERERETKAVRGTTRVRESVCGGDKEIWGENESDRESLRERDSE